MLRLIGIGCSIVIVLAGALHAGAAWLAQPERIAPADAIVVLAGGNPGRIARAVQLYHQGIAPQLWHTGHVRWRAGRPTSAEEGRNYAVARGVPIQAITLLPSTSTREDAASVGALARARGMRSVLVVTDWTHSRRALCAIRHELGQEVQILYAAPESSFGPEDWWRVPHGQRRVVQELVGNLFHGLYYGIVPWNC